MSSGRRTRSRMAEGSHRVKHLWDQAFISEYLWDKLSLYSSGSKVKFQRFSFFSKDVGNRDVCTVWVSSKNQIMALFNPVKNFLFLISVFSTIYSFLLLLDLFQFFPNFVSWRLSSLIWNIFLFYYKHKNYTFSLNLEIN